MYGLSYLDKFRCEGNISCSSSLKSPGEFEGKTDKEFGWSRITNNQIRHAQASSPVEPSVL